MASCRGANTHGLLRVSFCQGTSVDLRRAGEFQKSNQGFEVNNPKVVHHILKVVHHILKVVHHILIESSSSCSQGKQVMAFIESHR